MIIIWSKCLIMNSIRNFGINLKLWKVLKKKIILLMVQHCGDAKFIIFSIEFSESIGWIFFVFGMVTFFIFFLRNKLTSFSEFYVCVCVEERRENNIPWGIEFKCICVLRCRSLSIERKLNNNSFVVKISLQKTFNLVVDFAQQIGIKRHFTCFLCIWSKMPRIGCKYIYIYWAAKLRFCFFKLV